VEGEAQFFQIFVLPGGLFESFGVRRLGFVWVGFGFWAFIFSYSRLYRII